MNLSIEKLLEKATVFTFNALPEDVLEASSEKSKFNVTVEKRAQNQWAVVFFGYCYDKNLDRDWESSPSNRTEQFKEKYRFSLHEAAEIAEQLSQEVTLSGMNAAEYAIWWRSIP